MAQVTLVPTSDIVTGSWTTTPLFSKINEDFGSPDGTFISNTVRNDVFRCGMTDSPAEVGGVVKLTIRARSRATPDALHQLRISIKSSDLATVFAEFLASFLPTTFINQIGVFNKDPALTKAQIDDAIFEVESEDPGMANPGDWDIDTLNLDIEYIPSVRPETWHPPVEQPLIIIPSMIPSGNVKGYST